jgi:hypothetical protein
VPLSRTAGEEGARRESLEGEGASISAPPARLSRRRAVEAYSNPFFFRMSGALSAVMVIVGRMIFFSMVSPLSSLIA